MQVSCAVNTTEILRSNYFYFGKLRTSKHFVNPAQILSMVLLTLRFTQALIKASILGCVPLSLQLHQSRLVQHLLIKCIISLSKHALKASDKFFQQDWLICLTMRHPTSILWAYKALSLNIFMKHATSVKYWLCKSSVQLGLAMGCVRTSILNSRLAVCATWTAGCIIPNISHTASCAVTSKGTQRLLHTLLIKMSLLLIWSMALSHSDQLHRQIHKLTNPSRLCVFYCLLSSTKCPTWWSVVRKGHEMKKC